MSRQRFCKWIVILGVLASCSREQPAPNTTTIPTYARSPIPKPAATMTSYADAMTWFKSTKAFHFDLREGDVHAEGEMLRPTIGAEGVKFKIAGQEWIAQAKPQGVVWSREPLPPNGNRLFQRVTYAFDPQKVEGEAKLVEPDHYRFTDANTREVHDVWVHDGRITRMTIGHSVDLKLEP